MTIRGPLPLWFALPMQRIANSATFGYSSPSVIARSLGTFPLPKKCCLPTALTGRGARTWVPTRFAMVHLRLTTLHNILLTKSLKRSLWL